MVLTEPGDLPRGTHRSFNSPFILSHSPSSQFIRWVFARTKEFTEATAAINKVTTDAMKKYYDLSHNQWTTQKFLGLPEPTAAKRHPLPPALNDIVHIKNWSTRDISETSAMATILYAAILHCFKTKSTQAPTFTKLETKEHPQLLMLQRHGATACFGRNYRNKVGVAWAFAYQVRIGARFMRKMTTAVLRIRSSNGEPRGTLGTDLRSQFIRFLTRFAQPSVDNFAGPASNRSPSVNIEWRNWDDDMAAEINTEIAGLPEVSDDDIDFLGTNFNALSLDRWKKRTSEIKSVIQKTSSLECARTSKDPSSGIDPKVASALKSLVQVRLFCSSSAPHRASGQRPASMFTLLFACPSRPCAKTVNASRLAACTETRASPTSHRLRRGCMQ